jgi:hypothetical protein
MSWTSNKNAWKFRKILLKINLMSWKFKTNFLKITFLKIQELLAFGSRLHEYIPEFSGKIFYSVGS